MSWSGFKKAASRAGTQVMMKTGHVEKTTNREYEVEERRYRTLESASLRLQKEAKGYLDSLRAMTASQMRIAETIDAFYGEAGAKDGVSRSYKQAVEDLDAETVKALDGPYRTTVLEPIGRFCAYFPDINECIKKRNHKLLDYDAVRARVKKLTEKPDKDPGKLPRTEKEAEMVSTLHDYLQQTWGISSPSISFPTGPDSHTPLRAPKVALQARPDLDVDLSVPSPPKLLKGDDAEKMRLLQLEDEEFVRRHSGLKRSSSRYTRSSAPSSLPRQVQDDMTGLLRSGPVSFHHITPGSALQHGSSTDPRSPNTPFTLSQNPQPPATPSATQPGHQTPTTPSTTHTRGRKEGSKPDYSLKTPFFQPSELEQIMAPMKQQYLRDQANGASQAKVGYEQLNDQLTTELPQLIDLRVPYLDPSFEALVKIQLRFCAEAYSRMAQVQQYLDASTRDSYASGDLDARVEDVLGQIRELSIAGTV
ncbi:BAR adaptor protein Hob3 [Recurvomyces mirabilis]|nr:BAR adaptor protein Hob3 [Recurvomyces mirabilis]